MKVVLALLCLLLLSISIPKQSLAHYTQQDGDMSVVLHVYPGDNPVPGEEASIYFLFDDSSNRFSLSKCDCTVIISEKGKQIWRRKLKEKQNNDASIWGISIPYVFPRRDVYRITVTGKPLRTNDFGRFSISWDFRVSPDGEAGYIKEKQSDLPIIIMVIIGGSIFFVLFGWLIKTQIVNPDNIDNKKDKK